MNRNGLAGCRGHAWGFGRLAGLVAMVAALGVEVSCGPVGRTGAAEPPPPPIFLDDFSSGSLSKWDDSEGKPTFGPASAPGVIAPAGQTVVFGRREPLGQFTLRSQVRLPADGSRVNLRFLQRRGEKRSLWRGYLLSITRKGQDPFTLQGGFQVAGQEGKPLRDLGTASLVYQTAGDKLLDHWTKYAGKALAARWQAVSARRFEEAGKGVMLEVAVSGPTVTATLNGRLLFSQPTEHPAGGFEFELHNGAEVADVRVTPAGPDSPYMAIDLAGVVNRDGIATSANPGDGDLGDGSILPAEGLPPAGTVARIGGIPFRMPSYADGRLNVVDVGDSRWLESRDDGGRCRTYTGMRPGDGNPACLRLAVPREWYRAAYLLCCSTAPGDKQAQADAADTETLPEVTLRLGCFGYPYRIRDFVGRVPAWWQEEGPDCAGSVGVGRMGGRGGRAGRLFVVRIGLTSGDLATLIDGPRPDTFDLELTKRVHRAVHYPDPNHFVEAPLGPSSAVKVVALVLERSGVEMRVLSRTTGNVFVEPQKPGVDVELRSREDRPLSLHLGLESRHYFGPKEVRRTDVRLKPGERRVVAIDLPRQERGYYDLTVQVSDDRGPLATKHTSYCLLAADGRQALEDSPFGVWTFWGGHGFPAGAEGREGYYVRLMDMLYKAGIRYTFPLRVAVPANAPAEEKARLQASADRIARELEAHKVLACDFRSPGTFHPLWDKKRYDDPWPGNSLAESMAAVGTLKNATRCRMAELFAEDRISVRWLMQAPWWWQGMPRPSYDERERRNLDGLVRVASPWIDELRKQHPDVKVLLGNDFPLQIEALLNEGFIRKGYVDIAGIEAAQFMRMPENPTFLTVTAFARQMREALDMHGGQQVPIWSTEAFYPCTHPGNLAEQTQARYIARTLLVGLAAGLEKILKPFGIYDMSDDYRFSHWGMPGLCREDDEFQPKPSYVAYAVITQALDRRRYARKVETGSAVVYAPVFRGPDGREVCALWTLRGKRPAEITAAGGPAVVTDIMGRETRPGPAGGPIRVMVTPDPLFVAGPAVQGIRLGEPEYEDAGSGLPAAPAAGAAREPAAPKRSGEPPQGRAAGKRQLISSMDSGDQWQAAQETPGFLEANNFENPRVRGELRFEWGRPDALFGPCLAVTMPALAPAAKDPLIARCQVLELKKKVVLDGRPRWIGAWVRGCGNWGRLIYDLTDAEGERWISIGMPGQFNVNDPYNWSFLNHDGWRFVRHDLPGDFGGSERHHWPTQCIWGHFKPGPPDKDGKPTEVGNGIVDYPLTFKRLIVEMRDSIIYLDSLRHIGDNTILIKDLTVGDMEQGQEY